MSTRQETCAAYRGPCVASFQPALPRPSEKLQQSTLHPNRNSHRKRIETMRTCTDLTCSLRKRSRTRFASAPTMAPCMQEDRVRVCDPTPTSGYCMSIACRQAEALEKARRLDEARERRATAGGGNRGPLPGAGGRPQEEDSCRGQRKELQAQRAEAGGGNRGPLPGAGGRPQEEDSCRGQRKELQAHRAEAGGGNRGPLPGEGAGGRPQEEDSRRGQRKELQAAADLCQEKVPEDARKTEADMGHRTPTKHN